MALHVMDEANRCLGCKVPQCRKGCPIDTPIPDVIRLLKENKLDEAGEMLFMNNPLTTVCSLVCNHENQCEGHCVLGRKGAPVHFSTIENYISTTYAPKMRKGPAPSNGMRVAISRLRPCGNYHRNYLGAVWLPGHDLRGQGQNRRRAPLWHTGVSAAKECAG